MEGSDHGAGRQLSGGRSYAGEALVRHVVDAGLGFVNILLTGVSIRDVSRADMCPLVARRRDAIARAGEPNW
jgi:hypothetical protein